MVPDGWSQVRLSDLATIKRGAGSQYIDYVDNESQGIRLIRISDFLEDTKVFVKKTSDIERFKLTKNDLLIAGTGATAGIVFKVPESFGGLAFSYNAPRIRPKNADDTDFIYQYLISPEIIKQQSSLFTGNAQPFLDTKAISGFSILYPPEIERKKITDILSTWDKSIEATERLLENSKKRKKALMQQLLTGKKRLPGFSGEWISISLGEIGTTFSGLSGKNKEDFGSGSPYLTYMSIFSNQEVDLSKCQYVQVKAGETQSDIRYGDIFFTTSSETPEEVGMSSVLLKEPKCTTYLNSFCFGFRLNNFDSLAPEFAAHLLRSDDSRRKIALLGQGATRYNLSKKGLMKLTFSIPKKSEQIAIKEVLDAAQSECMLLNSKIEYLKSEKKGLMQQLLTGKKRVNVEAISA